jgi:four helix bundle protein
VTDFRRLLVWQKAHAFGLHADRVAAQIRVSRHSALRSQIVRAAISIPANIAEGRRQESEREFARFLRYALNSASEVEYHLLLAGDVGAIREDDASLLNAEVIEVRKMLYGLLRIVTTKKAGAASS